MYRNAARGFAVLRKDAISLIRQDHVGKDSIWGKRKKGWNNTYTAKLLFGDFRA